MNDGHEDSPGRGTLLGALRALLRRDLRLALRRRFDVLTVLLFFVIVATLFPLGIGPEPERLRAIGPGVIWVAALLASMLGLGRLFAADQADGTLEQLLVCAWPLSWCVGTRLAAHWLVTGLPLVLVAPLLALQFDMPQDAYGVLALSLLLGTPVLGLVGAIGAALALGARGGGGALVALLVLPLYVPMLILGAGAAEAAAGGIDATAHLMLQGACLLVAAAFAPWAVAAGLRISVE